MQTRLQIFVWTLLVALLIAGCSSGASQGTRDGGSGGEQANEASNAEGDSADDSQDDDGSENASERLTFAGSTTVQPLAEKLGEVYRQQNRNVELEIGAGGSRVGIQAVQEGTADIGMASRELKEGEQTEGMEVYQIAVDVLAMIVHPSNPVEELSLEQLKGIYTGEITNWSEVGGEDVPIVPVIRETTSGTRGAFDEIVLGDEEPIETEDNTEVTAGEVHAHVAESEGAIGYVGFGHLSGDDVNVVSIDGVEPSPESAKDGTYKLKRPLQLMTGPLSRPLATEFIDFVLSEEGQKIVIDDGWVPVSD